MTAGAEPPSGTIRDWIERHARQTPDKVSHLFADGSPDLTWSGLLGGERRRLWVFRARIRDARANASLPSHSVAAVSDFVVRSISATRVGENTWSSTNS